MAIISNLTTGIDVLFLTSAKDEIRATADTLTAGDSIDGGGGFDQLRLQSAGQFDFRIVASILFIPDIYLDNDNATLYMADGMNVRVHTLGAGDVVYGGTGAETIDFSNAVSEIHSGGGDDQVVVWSLAYMASTLKLDGGGGNDELYIAESGSVDFDVLGLFTGFERVILGAGNDKLVVNQGVLNATQSINGGSGTNEIQAAGTSIDLTVGASLINFSRVSTKNTVGTEFFLPAANPFSNVAGGSGNDTFHAFVGQFSSVVTFDGGAGTDTFSLDSSGAYDLTAMAGFTGIEKITSTSGDNTLTVNAAILGALTSIDLGTGSNVLKSTSTTMDLTGKTLAHIQTLEALSAGTTFIVDNTQLAAGGGSITAVTAIGTGNSLSTAGAELNATGLALTNIQQFTTSSTIGTTFTLASSLSNTTVTGGSGNDTIHAVVGQFDGTDNLDGGAGTDTFSLDGSGAYDLTAIGSFASFEKIASTSGDNTLTVDATILGTLASIDLGTGSNVLKSTSATMDLTGKSLAHVQTLQASSAGTTFILDNTQLTAGGGPIATIAATGTGNILSTAGTTLDITGLTLTNIRQFATNNTAGTSFTLTSGLSNVTVTGGSGNDTIHATVGQFGATDSLDGGAGTDSFSLDGSGAYDLTAIGSFASFEKIISTSGNNTLTVSDTILGSLTAIDLGTGSNVLKSAATTIDLSGKTLAHIQTVEGTHTGTTFIIDNTQLTAGGGSISTVTGTGTGNILSTAGVELNATGLSLTNIQQLTTSNTSGTSFTLTGSLSNMAVTGGSGNDTIHATVGEFDGTDSLDGGAGTDSFSLDGSGAYDLTTIGSFANIEKIASTSGNNTLTVNATILGALTSIDLGTGSNVLQSAATTIDLSGKALVHVQTLEATHGGAAIFVDDTQLTAAGGSVATITATGTGNSLITSGAMLDTTGMTLTNIQTIKAGSSVATTLIDSADAHAVIGGAGADILTGGGGADQLTGGAGADTFRDTAAHLSGTTITDLTAADTIDLTDIALAGATASFAAGMLTVKSGASTVAEIALTGSYDNNFKLVSDGAAGLSIAYGGALSAPSGPSGPGPAVPTFGDTVRLSADGSGLPLVGTRGNDAFAGSSDPSKIDTVMENGTKFGQNTITRQADGSIDIVGANGHDHLTGVERIVFDDGVLILNLPQSANTMTALYRVMFDRTPDEAGIKWQIDTFDSGASLNKIASIFLDSEEASFIRLPNLGNADFVTKLYDNAFDRQPEAGGLQYWITALDHGASRESVALFFVQSQEEVDLVGQVNKVGIFSAYPQAGL